MPESKPKGPARAGKKPAARPTTKAGANGKRATKSGSRLVDERIRSLADWRGETLAEVRRLIRAADPDVVEECKWVKPTNPLGVPVWTHDGIVCTGEVYKDVVKLTFARGASLADPKRLFNSGLDGNTRRAIDLREGEVLNAAAFRALVRAAVAENLARSQESGGRSQKSRVAGGSTPAPGKKVVLLSGGNPQIAKADGDAPVRAYITAIPGWKREIGERLDALVARLVPGVRRAVKWNSPFYGVEGRGWFLGFHCFTKYVKVTFFRGTSLRPVPPGGTGKDARWVDIHEDDFDEAQLTDWVKQAAALPGWAP